MSTVKRVIGRFIPFPPIDLNRGRGRTPLENRSDPGSTVPDPTFPALPRRRPADDRNVRPRTLRSDGSPHVVPPVWFVHLGERWRIGGRPPPPSRRATRCATPGCPGPGRRARGRPRRRRPSTTTSPDGVLTILRDRNDRDPGTPGGRDTRRSLAEVGVTRWPMVGAAPETTLSPESTPTPGVARDTSTNPERVDPPGVGGGEQPPAPHRPPWPHRTPGRVGPLERVRSSAAPHSPRHRSPEAPRGWCQSPRPNRRARPGLEV